MMAEGARGEDRTRDMVYLAVAEIARTPGDVNARVRYDEPALEELTASVREHGVLQPVLVRPIQTDEGTEWRQSRADADDIPPYVLVAGNRRLEAAKRAGREMIPAVIRVATRDEAFVLNLVENIQRESLQNAFGPSSCLPACARSTASSCLHGVSPIWSRRITAPSSSG